MTPNSVENKDKDNDDFEVMDFLINLQETLGSKHQNQESNLKKVVELLKVHQEKRVINQALTEEPAKSSKVKI